MPHPQTSAEKFSPLLSAAQCGRLGGQVTAQRHGSVHMDAIGRAGFWATVEKHFGGDVAAYMRMLRTHRAQGATSAALGCNVQHQGQSAAWDLPRGPDKRGRNSHPQE